MREADELAAALSQLPTRTYCRVLFRAVLQAKLYGYDRPTPYPNIIPLYSRGSVDHGGRYTPRGSMETLYMAEDPTTAYMEVDRAYKKAEGLNRDAVPPTAPPIILFQCSVYIEAILDLTLPEVQAALGTNEEELTRPWRLLQKRGGMPPTQTLGRLAFDSGRFQSIRAPSGRSRGGVCLAVFTGRITAPSFVEVYDPYGQLSARLPPF